MDLSNDPLRVLIDGVEIGITHFEVIDDNGTVDLRYGLINGIVENEIEFNKKLNQFINDFVQEAISTYAQRVSSDD